MKVEYRLILLINTRKKNNKDKKILLQIIVSKSNEKTAKACESIYSSIHSTIVKDSFINWIVGKSSPNFSFEIACVNKHVYFYCYCGEQYKDLIISQLYSQYPDIEIEQVDDYVQTKIENDIGNIYAELETDNSYIYPIKRHPQFEDNNTKIFLDPLSSITSALSSLGKNEILSVQILISPIGNIYRQRAIWVSNKIKGGFNLNSEKYKKWYTDMLLTTGIKQIIYLILLRPILFTLGLGPKSVEISSGERSEVEESHKKETIENGISGKLSQQLFGVSIRFMYIAGKNDIKNGKSKINNMISSFHQFNIPRFNSFRTKKINVNLGSCYRKFRRREISDPFILNIEELATIWHLPNISVDVPNIQWIKSKSLEPPLNLPIENEVKDDELTLLGKTSFRGENIKFGIKKDDRRRHIYIIGKTGMGKTTMLENMIISDINNGKGVAVIDPHGDLAENILNFIPKSRTNDVMIFDPDDKDFPVSFNMLECKNPEHRHLIASGLLGVFKKMFGESWGPRLQHILRNTLLALTERKDSTLL